MKHQHHHHARAPAADPEPQFFGFGNRDPDPSTVVNVVFVTEAANPFGGFGNAQTTEAPSISRQNGNPLMQTANPFGVQSSSTYVYSAPPRQNRPDKLETSSEAPAFFGFPAPSSTSEAPAFFGFPVASSTSEAPAFFGFPAATSTATSSESSPVFAPKTTLLSSVASTSAIVGSATTITRASRTLAGAAATATDAENDAASTGMSGGGKAGLAIGILLIIALLAGLAFFLYRRKKNEKQEHQRWNDEKVNMYNATPGLSSHVSVRKTKNNAPRLSLRPLTQLFPTSEKHDASTLIAGSAATARARTPEPTFRAVTPNLPRVAPNESGNPFDDQAQEKPVVTAPAPTAAPLPAIAKSERTVSDLSDTSPTAAGQSFNGAAAAADSRRNSPPGPGPNNVHRVQLDFKPSMEDELELRAGSLVRLLHEYDDGWALCIRLDRSQQGVVPRTCISKLPVKPRPGPPPGMRGPPPQGRPRGPPNGPGPRMGPNGAPRPMGPPPAGRYRSQSNAPRQSRPQSPAMFQGAEQGRPRANSDAMSARRISPPSSTASSSTSPPQATMPSRKPVPGQAM